MVVKAAKQLEVEHGLEKRREGYGWIELKTRNIEIEMKNQEYEDWDGKLVIQNWKRLEKQE